MTPPNELFTGRRSWGVALTAAVVLAGVMRAAGLGTWSFASDELGTFVEVRQFFDPTTMKPDDPDRHVPKMIPLSMALLGAGHQVFGTDEAGCRAVPAISGLTQILLVGLVLRELLGRTTALTVVLLLALAPEHLLYCHYHRFYAVAALFVGIAQLAGARAVRYGSVRWMVAAVVAAIAAVLVHSLVGLVFGGLVAGALAARLVARGGSLRPLLIALAGAFVAALYAALYLYPLGKGKAIGYAWEGRSIPEAIASGVYQLSLPVALFALPGLLILWRRDRVQAAFWGVQAAVWAGALIVLPKLLPFHSAYVFPLCLPLFVLAGVAFAEIADRLVIHGRVIATTVLAALLLLNLPSVASHYRDGSRHDFRAAANFVADRIGPNDIVVAVQRDKLMYYRPELADRCHRPPFQDVETWLEPLRPKDGKVWIVLPGGRGGLPGEWRAWAERVGRPQATVVHRRFDYHEYPIFILLEDRPGTVGG